MLNNIFKAIPNFEKIQVAPVLDQSETVGWNATVLTPNEPIGSGTHFDKNIAIRIAIAESLERSLLISLKKNNVEDYHLDLHPTTSGFACGFNRYLTSFRSFCEAIERWAWSKWIDEQIGISKCRIDISRLSKLDLFFLNSFDDYDTFEITLKVKSSKFHLDELHFGIFLGFKDSGIFPGSRVTTSKDFTWSHPLVEAWRHFKISQEGIQENSNSIITKRIKYFGKNKSSAIKQIPNEPSAWPMPDILFHKEVITDLDDVFLWRTICKDFKGWHLGDETRFVY